MPLGNRLRAARKSAGYTQKELAEKIGAKHNSVSNWENGLNMPDPETIRTICCILDITPNYLLMAEDIAGGSSRNEALSTVEMTLLKKYRGLDKKAKGAVDTLLEYYHGLAAERSSILAGVGTRRFSESGKASPAFEVLRGLISTQSVAAGTGTYLDPDNFDEFFVEKNEITQKAAFYVPVSGNSMEPKFHDGDILIIENAPAKLGEIGIFTLDGHGFVKVRGETELISLNPNYEPIPMNDSIICNGKVIGVLESAWVID